MLGFKSPYEVLKETKIDLSHLKVFGCICFVHTQPTHRDKLDPRAVRCVFMGYSSTQKSYKCYNPVTKKRVVSRDVRFDEFVDTNQGQFMHDFFLLPNIPSYQEKIAGNDTPSSHTEPLSRVFEPLPPPQVST